MHRTIRTTLALSLLALAVTVAAAGAAVSVGEKAPDFTLPDLQGEKHTLSDYQGKVVVLEWINPNCPFSERHAKSGTMTELADENEVVWLSINSTAKDHKDYLDPKKHLAYNEKYGIDYPVLYDVDGKVGHAYDAKTTPHMIVIDEQGEVVYDGAIDDDPYGRADAPENYVAAALAAHGAGKAADPSTTKPYGCSVKYGG